MSGHSKWSSIKHKKAAIDQKRGKVFTKAIKEITVAAREGGGDSNRNASLRTAILSSKGINMPTSNIERAIKKGLGEIPGVNYEPITYEGYGASGIAIVVDVLTDNKNRTHPELRKIFEKNHGHLGAAGCVAWMFQKKGEIRVKKEDISEDDLMNFVLEAGGEDLDASDEEAYLVYTQVSDFYKVKSFLEDKKVPIMGAQLTMVPKDFVRISEVQAGPVLRLMEELEDHDDVQNVYSNFDIMDEAS